MMPINYILKCQGDYRFSKLQEKIKDPVTMLGLFFVKNENEYKLLCSFNESIGM